MDCTAITALQEHGLISSNSDVGYRPSIPFAATIPPVAKAPVKTHCRMCAVAESKRPAMSAQAANGKASLRRSAPHATSTSFVLTKIAYLQMHSTRVPRTPTLSAEPREAILCNANNVYVATKPIFSKSAATFTRSTDFAILSNTARRNLRPKRLTQASRASKFLRISVGRHLLKKLDMMMTTATTTRAGDYCQQMTLVKIAGLLLGHRLPPMDAYLLTSTHFVV
jgi:hypothetical protein